MLSNEFRIVHAFLLTPFKQLYGREIERLAGISHSRAVEYLKSLSKRNILKSERRGNQVLYSLNQDNEVALKALSIAEMERKIEFFSDKLIEKSITYRLVSEILEELRDILSFTLLFGSFARGHAKESSDLDILFVVSDKAKGRRSIERIVEKLEKSTGRSISPHIVSNNDLEQKWLEEPIYKSIWEERILLYGEERFWSFVFMKGGHQ
jgi:predicted nucleotidyltransferase